MPRLLRVAAVIPDVDPNSTEKPVVRDDVRAALNVMGIFEMDLTIEPIVEMNAPLDAKGDTPMEDILDALPDDCIYCDHEKSQHRKNKGDCLKKGCDCDEYQAPAAPELDDEGHLHLPKDMKPGEYLFEGPGPDLDGNDPVDYREPGEYSAWAAAPGQLMQVPDHPEGVALSWLTAFLKSASGQDVVTNKEGANGQIHDYLRAAEVLLEHHRPPAVIQVSPSASQLLWGGPDWSPNSSFEGESTPQKKSEQKTDG